MSDQHLDLLGLLRGELTNAEITSAADHLDSCTQCRDELAETAVGHALLTGATRSLAGGTPVGALPEPPALTLPPARRQWSRPVGLVAAAAVLVAGTAGATTYLTRPADEPLPAAVEQTADLEPVDGTGGGRVVMASTDTEVTMTVETHDLPTIKPGQFYYVWLFNPNTQKMLPLGVVGPKGSANFSIPDSLLGRYQVVDVSLEKDDGDPGHSVTSVLRASYAGDSGAQES